MDNINPFAASFTEDIVQALKQFITQGGGYLGVCGGGYVASSGWEGKRRFIKAMGLVPYESESYMEDADPQIIQIKWNNENRSIYYQYGPKFLLTENSSDNVMARYDDNSIAAFSMSMGQGKVVLVGPHPEANETWIDDSVKNADAWTSTHDLAQAMMQEALRSDETSLQADIKANGSDGPITVTPNDTVSITFSHDPGSRNGHVADWWIVLNTSFASPADWFSYTAGNGWVQGASLYTRAEAIRITSVEILNIPLPVGNYTFYICLDDPDGQPAGDWWGLDAVQVNVE